MDKTQEIRATEVKKIVFQGGHDQPGVMSTDMDVNGTHGEFKLLGIKGNPDIWDSLWTPESCLAQGT